MGDPLVSKEEFDSYLRGKKKSIDSAFREFEKLLDKVKRIGSKDAENSLEILLQAIRKSENVYPTTGKSFNVEGDVAEIQLSDFTNVHEGGKSKAETFLDDYMDYQLKHDNYLEKFGPPPPELILECRLDNKSD